MLSHTLVNSVSHGRKVSVQNLELISSHHADVAQSQRPGAGVLRPLGVQRGAVKTDE